LIITANLPIGYNHLTLLYLLDTNKLLRIEFARENLEVLKMTKKLVRRNDWRDSSGVSEVVGTILILLMTVVLFSGIIIWIWGMPTPKDLSRVEITAEFNAIDLELHDPPTWDVVFINLTHRGGEELKGSVLEIHLNVNKTIEILKVVKYGDERSGEGEKYGISGTDNNWNIGEVWQLKNWSIEYHHKIKITLIDNHRSVILWENDLWGYEGVRPPIFLEKWTDGNPAVNSTVRDPVEDNKTSIYTGEKIPFGIFAKVVDLDKDLLSHSVFVRFTFGPLEGNEYRMVDNGSSVLCDAMADDSVFSICKDEFWPASDWLEWSGRLLILNASDATGHETSTRLRLYVYNYGDKINIEPDPGGGGIPPEWWDYIGFVQVDIDDLFWTHSGEWPEQGGEGPTHYHPIYRINDKHIQKDYNGHKSMIWHMVMNNHGNRTIFLDAYSIIKWSEGTSTKWRHILANDTSEYPHTGNPGQEGDIFEFAYEPDYILDVNLEDQAEGGMQLDVKFGAKSIANNDFGDAGSTGPNNNPHPLTLSLTGIMGPVNKTMQDISDEYCGGGEVTMSCYNPVDYINEPDEWQTKWYGQSIPFLSVWVFSQGGAGDDDNPEYDWPPPNPPWY